MGYLLYSRHREILCGLIFASVRMSFSTPFKMKIHKTWNKNIRVFEKDSTLRFRGKKTAIQTKQRKSIIVNNNNNNNEIEEMALV